MMLRRVYAWLLRLHPPYFREQFAGEMLWIFDECGAREARRLLADAATSVVRQWCFRSYRPGAQTEGVPVPDGSGVPSFYSAPSDGPRREAVVQGAAVALALMLGVFSLMGKGPRPSWMFRIGSDMPRSGLGVKVDREGAPTLTTKIGVKTKVEPNHGFVYNYYLMSPVLTALDQDHDLILTEDEIVRAPAALRNLDLNRDGKLSAEECGFGGMAHGQSSDDFFKELIAYDRNADGKLDATELPERFRNLLARASQDADGRVPFAEIRRIAGIEADPKRVDADPALGKRLRFWYMRMHPVLAALDTNHDGEIATVEIATAAAAVRTLDWDHNGQITAEEVLPDNVTHSMIVYMIRFDTDGDSRLSKQELAAMPKEMAAMLRVADRDGDGVIAESELMNEIRRLAIADQDSGARQLRIAQGGETPGDKK